jgi:tripartite-type tricarboxylate transporter receptor subunit TctC
MKQSKKRSQLSALIVAMVLLTVGSAAHDGFCQAPFYQGKTLTIIHGRSAGGAGDFRVRAVAPFLHKYIPGNPTIVHEYMDGGGGRKAANHIFNSARPDGLTIGNVGGGAKQGFSTISKSFTSSARLSAQATIYF